MEPFQALEDFQPEDKEAVIKLIDAMIVKHKVGGAEANRETGGVGGQITPKSRAHQKARPPRVDTENTRWVFGGVYPERSRRRLQLPLRGTFHSSLQPG